MKNILVRPGSPLRNLFPLVHRLRRWAWKFHDRTGRRLVISGGRVRFMDVDLEFPESVALAYSTPLFWNGPDAYESPTSRALALLASRAKSFLDVGSNMGIYSVYVGVKFPEVKVFAFEPVPSIWEKNRRFHQANRLSDKNVLNLALSNRASRQTMVLPQGTGGLEEEQTATLREDVWMGQENRVTKFEIECVTLDSFAATHPLPDGLCCVKIDVENFEAAVFQGGRQFLRERRPWIVCEILPDQGIDPVTKKYFNTNSEVVAEIRESRYTPFAIMAEGFFRMTPADFERPRGFKDFLLIPMERLTGDHAYLSPTCLAEFLVEAMKRALIATLFNEADNISRWWDCLMRQTVLPDEIVIVDGGSTDGTWEQLQKLAEASRVPVKLDQHRCNIAEGRNRAIRLTDAEIIVTSDAGSFADANWFDEITRPMLANQALDIVGGKNVPLTENEFQAFVTRLETAPAEPKEGELNGSARNTAFRRATWAAVGGYPEWLTLTGEDALFNLQLFRIGKRFSYNPHAVVRWEIRNNAAAYFKMFYAYGYGSAEAQLNPSYFLRRMMIVVFPPLLLLSRHRFQFLKFRYRRNAASVLGWLAGRRKGHRPPAGWKKTAGILLSPEAQQCLAQGARLIPSKLQTP